MTGILDLSALNGNNGFVINGVAENDAIGSVSGIGDFNGDGFNDLIIGASGADPDGVSSGASYLLFGSAAGFPRVINLSDLDGINGFLIRGIDQFDFTGRSVAGAGDFNGDGFNDIIIGADGGDANGVSATGEGYILFGAATGFGDNFSLENLDGSNGFVINGVNEADQIGWRVAGAGDVNGDGFDDIVIGGIRVGGSSGASYVIFGSNAGFEASFNLSDLDGSNGFALFGAESGDESGGSVALADINGDGFEDVIIGANGARVNGRPNAGETYVVFGAATGFAASLELSDLDGTDGFVIQGFDSGGRSGRSVASAGDLNGDGFEDLIIGAPSLDARGNQDAGQAYVVFGAASGYGSALDLSSLNGANGFAISGSAAFDRAGASVSGAGDVNGDGFDDIVIGAGGADPNGIDDAGSSYVIFGSPDGFGSTFDLASLDGTNGFVINGIDQDDQSGARVSGARDLNGDGFDDLIIVAATADSNDNNNAGEIYVIFGGPTVGLGNPVAGGIQFNSSANVNVVENSTGRVIDVDARLNGGEADTGVTYSITGGEDGTLFDIDADTGLISFVAAPDFENPGDEDGDNIYVVEVTATGDGEEEVQQLSINVIDVQDDTVEGDVNPASFNLSGIDGSNGAVINGISSGGNAGFSVAGAGDVNGDGFADVIIGAINADPDGRGATGQSYVIFGRADGLGDSFNLSDLDGSNGFAINGIDPEDRSGFSVAGAGDINGDGFDDIIIGAPNADPNGNEDAGESYVIFGREGGFEPAINLSDLDGANGFIVEGSRQGAAGTSVAGLGDLNGDGLDDLVVGSPFPFTGRTGNSFVVYGRTDDFETRLLLGDLASGEGLNITSTGSSDGSRLGGVVAGLGDFNGDGVNDLLIGAPFADPNAAFGVGQSYVLFGEENGFERFGGFLRFINLSDPSGSIWLNGSNGFSIDASADSVGVVSSAAGAGDFNGDGFDDLIIGVARANVNGIQDAGESFVLFGGAGGFDRNIDFDDLDGTNGFVISGIGANDESGGSVSNAGDLNGDGFDDLIIGAAGATPSGVNRAGASYVIFGTANGIPARFNLSDLDGANGFVISGADPFDGSGASVAGAGDINGDGFDDLIIGAPFGDPNTSDNAGEAYIIYGGPSFGAIQFNSAAATSVIENSTGSIISVEALLNGTEAGLEYSISGGADQADFFINQTTGELRFNSTADFEQPADANRDNTYRLEVTVTNALGLTDTQLISITVMDDTLEVSSGSDTVTGSAANDIVSTDAGDDFVNGLGGADVLLGGDGSDTLDGGAGNDFLRGDEGDDLMIAGAGNDQAFAGPGDTGDDTLAGNAGNDVLGGGAGDDLIVGGDFGDDADGGSTAGSDTLFGGAGDDLLAAGAYNSQTSTSFANGTEDNILWAGDGNDTLFGDNGDDVLGGGRGNDAITGADGNDTIYGGIGSATDNKDSLDGGDGNDLVFASADDDTVNGGNDSDTLFGGAGDDTIDGGTGDDLIFGGGGDDAMTGGSGDDTFSFVTGFGTDTIKDFGAAESDSDILDFSEIEGLTLEGILSAATFSDAGATLIVGVHGTIVLDGLDQSELQAIFDNGQVIIG